MHTDPFSLGTVLHAVGAKRQLGGRRALPAPKHGIKCRVCECKSPTTVAHLSFFGTNEILEPRDRRR